MLLPDMAEIFTSGGPEVCTENPPHASESSKTSDIQTHISEFYINRGTLQAPVLKKHTQKISNVHDTDVNTTQEVSIEIATSK